MYCVAYTRTHVLRGIDRFIPCQRKTANQKPGKLLHILQYATGNMQWVVFHSTFPSLLARNSYAGVLLETSQN